MALQNRADANDPRKGENAPVVTIDIPVAPEVTEAELDLLEAFLSDLIAEMLNATEADDG